MSNDHKKEFDKWNKIKKKTHNNRKRPHYHEREVWWCTLGVNIGTEQDGTGKNFDRPAVVIKGFSKNSLVVIPLVGRKKKGKFYLPLGKIYDREASAILSQVRLIDSKRLLRKIETLNKEAFKKLKKKSKNSLF